MAAVNKGQLGTVNILLERGANPNMQDHVSVGFMLCKWTFPLYTEWLVSIDGSSVQKSQ